MTPRFWFIPFCVLGTVSALQVLFDLGPLLVSYRDEVPGRLRCRYGLLGQSLW